MKYLKQLHFLLQITDTQDIIRRYMVVNGFDGALTMLGLLIGFLLSGTTDLVIVVDACLGAAIALGVSGLSSAYVSEVAERKRSLDKLEEAMASTLEDSAHADAARWVPFLIAFANGISPVALSLLIIMPLWFVVSGYSLPIPALYASMVIAFLLIFLLGVFLGTVAGTSWLLNGFRTLVIAMITVLLIYLFVK